MPQDIKRIIQNLKSKGLPQSSIINNLKQQGFSNRDIYQNIQDSEMQPANDQYSEDVQEPGGMNFEAPSPEENDQQDFMSQPEDFESESPSFSQQGPQQKMGQPSQISPQRQTIEQIEEIAESIIDEKWDELMADVGDITIWKEKTTDEIEAIKQEVIRLRNSFENLQVGVIGKVNEYNKNIGNVSAEMKALTQLFQKIIEPLTSNVKELGRITQAMKKKE